IGVVLALTHSRQAPPAAAIARFSFTLPEGQIFPGSGVRLLAISPDGARVVYAANRQLYLRSIGDMESHAIPGTNLSALSPFFSPDSQWVGFYSLQDATLKKVSITGGAALTICKADNPFGVSWDGDQIVFGQPRGIMRVSANGGEPEVLAQVKVQEI